MANDARPLARLANCRVGDQSSATHAYTVGPVLGVPPTGGVDPRYAGRAGIGRSETVADHGAVGRRYHRPCVGQIRLSELRVTILLRCETLCETAQLLRCPPLPCDCPTASLSSEGHDRGTVPSRARAGPSAAGRVPVSGHARRWSDHAGRDRGSGRSHAPTRVIWWHPGGHQHVARRANCANLRARGRESTCAEGRREGSVQVGRPALPEIYAAHRL
ncbi:Conserved protein of unknown function [Mycobacterium canettii CIPT 140070010]|nr:Conserved protein of unknown function [Mycobacterium canettii CIPT 140070010]